jgi:hypothetical protein
MLRKLFDGSFELSIQLSANGGMIFGRYTRLRGRYSTSAMIFRASTDNRLSA